MFHPAVHRLPPVIVLALWLCSVPALLAQNTPPSMKFTRLSVKDPGFNPNVGSTTEWRRMERRDSR